jgi:hypothetical protein
MALSFKLRVVRLVTVPDMARRDSPMWLSSRVVRIGKPTTPEGIVARFVKLAFSTCNDFNAASSAPKLVRGLLEMSNRTS